MINGMSEDFRATLDVVRNEIVEVNMKVSLTMRALANQAPGWGAITIGKIKILKPNPFCGARDAKALENFIFNIEQYFKATNTVAEEAKVSLATLHLSEDAKLWWRSQYIDIQEGRYIIDTWDSLKRELRSQFFSGKCRDSSSMKTAGIKAYWNHSGVCEAVCGADVEHIRHDWKGQDL